MLIKKTWPWNGTWSLNTISNRPSTPKQPRPTCARNNPPPNGSGWASTKIYGIASAPRSSNLRRLKVLKTPSYRPKADSDLTFYRCRVKIAHPHGNFGPRLPNLLTAACGEGTFFSPGITVIKLLNIEFPDTFLNHFQGPKFGIKGLRDILGVYDRPLFLGVIKPNIGLPPNHSPNWLIRPGWGAWTLPKTMKCSQTSTGRR